MSDSGPRPLRRKTFCNWQWASWTSTVSRSLGPVTGVLFLLSSQIIARPCRLHATTRVKRVPARTARKPKWHMPAFARILCGKVTVAPVDQTYSHTLVREQSLFTKEPSSDCSPVFETVPSPSPNIRYYRFWYGKLTRYEYRSRYSSAKLHCDS